jgi:Fe2+ or Zn2+ uptake regulation protein
MVAQKVVQEVMEILNRPCKPREIANYMIENKLSNIASDIGPDISTCLNQLRKWQVVDKLPDFHGKDSSKWYLTNNKYHDFKTCEICKSIRTSHSKHIGNMASKSAWRKRKNTEEQDQDNYQDLSAPRWGRGSDV